jgi:three-Cys-motif partner protein
MKNETLFGAPDEFHTPEVGSYTEDKYDLVRLYCHLFSSGMKEKWRGKRTFVDLYAGPGKCRVKGSEKVLLGSPLIALSVPEQFDRYVFCEENPERFASLKARLSDYAKCDIRLIEGNCNRNVKEICALIPRGNLVLCFVDPYDTGFKMETIRQISTSAHGVDFLFLLAFQMDAARGDNPKHYANPENTKLDGMLGHSEWRARWQNAQSSRNTDFAKFLATEFSLSMELLEYLPVELHQMRQIRRVENNAPLYYLALFSKNQRAFDFWGKVLKYSTRQRGLFD